MKKATCLAPMRLKRFTVSGNKHLIGKMVYYRGFERVIKNVFSPKRGVILLLLEHECDDGLYYYETISASDNIKLQDIYMNCEEIRRLEKEFANEMKKFLFFDYNDIS